MESREYAAPEPTGLSKKAISALAEHVASQLGFKPGSNIHEVVGRLGGTIGVKDYWDLEARNSGSIIVEGPKKFVIYVARHTAPLRDRFTIAHELGHYFVHYIWPRQQKLRDIVKLQAARNGSGRVEWEANWFAAAFLMPLQPFRDALKASDNDIVSVADQFQVSVAAAEVRARAVQEE